MENEEIITILKERMVQHQKGIDHCVAVIKISLNEPDIILVTAKQMEMLSERQKEDELIIWRIENQTTK